jgi:hypothetical protein
VAACSVLTRIVLAKKSSQRSKSPDSHAPPERRSLGLSERQKQFHLF